MIKLGELIAVQRALGVKFCNKERHKSQGAAEAHVRALRTLQQSETVAYECRYRNCPTGTWHMGHKAAEAPKGV